MIALGFVMSIYTQGIANRNLLYKLEFFISFRSTQRKLHSRRLQTKNVGFLSVSLYWKAYEVKVVFLGFANTRDDPFYPTYDAVLSFL